MTLELQLPRSRDCGARARRWLEQELGHRLDARVLEDLKLVVSELVDNAFLHGRGRIRLRVTPRRDRVRVEVVDEGRGAAIKIRRDGPDIGGWGLKLVDRLTTRWGAYEGTTHVWAELSTAPGAGP